MPFESLLDAGELEEDTGSGDVLYFSLRSIVNCYFQVTQIRQKIREVLKILKCWFSTQFVSVQYSLKIHLSNTLSKPKVYGWNGRPL